MSDEGVTNSLEAAAKAASRVRRVRAIQMVLLSGLLFVSGGITGWSVYRFAPPPPPPEIGSGANDQPDPPVQLIVQHYQRDLGLSDDQAEKMREIYRKRFAALKAIRETMKPEYAGLKTDMQGILSAEQFAKWDKKYEEVRNRMLPPPPPPPRERPNGMGPPGMGGPEGPGMNGPGGEGPPPDGPGGGDGPPRGGPRSNPPPMGGNGP